MEIIVSVRWMRTSEGGEMKKATIAMFFVMLGVLLPGQKAEAKLTENGADVFSVSTSDSFDDKQALTYGRVLCLKNSGSSNGGAAGYL